MKHFTITKDNFIQWYLIEENDETESIKEDLADRMIVHLRQYGAVMISVQDLFNECNKEGIRLRYLEQFDGSDTDLQLEDIKGEWEVKLVDNP